MMVNKCCETSAVQGWWPASSHPCAIGMSERSLSSISLPIDDQNTHANTSLKIHKHSQMRLRVCLRSTCTVHTKYLILNNSASYASTDYQQKSSTPLNKIYTLPGGGGSQPCAISNAHMTSSTSKIQSTCSCRTVSTL